MRLILIINLVIQKKPHITSSNLSRAIGQGRTVLVGGLVSLHLTEGVSYGES